MFVGLYYQILGPKSMPSKKPTEAGNNLSSHNLKDGGEMLVTNVRLCLCSFHFRMMEFLKINWEFTVICLILVQNTSLTKS
jgi:hypothetical protein